MRKLLVSLSMIFVSLGVSLPCFSAESSPDAPSLRAAVFIQNRAGAEFTDKLDVLNDLLTTRLTDKGFSVIDRSVVVAKFREARDLDPALQRDVTVLEKAAEGSHVNGGIENSLSAASALRISQMIGADYLVMASLTSFGEETRSFQGEGTSYGTSNKSYVYTLRIALKVLEGNSGGTVYGDLVSVAERVAVVERLKITSTEVVNKLLDAGALKAADNVSAKIQKIRDVKVQTAAVVEFSVSSSVDGATVELDGAVIGSTPGRFAAAPGLHQLRISKQWLTTWDKTVNIFANQLLNVTLELSAEGLARYSTLEQLKLDLAKTKMQSEMDVKEREGNIEINKMRGDADAYSKKAIADGEKKKQEESNDRTEIVPSTEINK